MPTSGLAGTQHSLEVTRDEVARLPGAQRGRRGTRLRGQKNFHKAFAPVSPVFVSRAHVLLGVIFVLGVAAFGAFPMALRAAASEADNTTTAVKRQAASSQYLRAEEQRSALNSKAPEKRTLAEYKQAVASYHRVTLITPR